MKRDSPPLTRDEPVRLSAERDFSLGDLDIHPSVSEASRGEERQHVEPRVMQVLVALASAAGAGGRRILAPEDGSVVALDPDIPPAVQRLRFEAALPLPAGAAWRLDGKRLGAARPLAWSPWPGHHELALVDAAGEALETVAFDVRGAQARAAQAPRPAARRRPPG